MRNVEHLRITPPMGMARRIRAKIAEADADPRPSLMEEEVDRHFQARRQSTLNAGGRDA